MDPHIEELDTMEEEDDPFLPPFANKENKALNALIRRLEKQLDLVDQALEENNDRIKVMHEHLRNVQQELTYTESRVEAQNKEIKSEHHLKQLADREKGRLSKDIVKLEDERGQLAERLLVLQQQVLRGQAKMDQFRAANDWNQEELEQWATAQRQKEEDNLALEKYRRQDEARIKELTQRIEKITKQVARRKEDLEREITDTQASQIQLNRAADDFRQLHGERQELLKQWDEAVEALRRRDEAIQVASEQFALRKQELRQLKAELDSQARFLQREIANNAELDVQIAAVDREVSKQREVLTAEQARAAELNGQVDISRATLSKTTTELGDASNSNRAVQQALDKKQAQIETARRKLEAAQAQLSNEYTSLDTLEARMAELERIRKAEEIALKGLQRDSEDLRKEQFRQGQVLFNLRQKERELINEITGGQGQNRNLAARLAQLDEQVGRQQELLYSVDFQLQEMERKVARARGVRSDEETKQLNARIQQLTTVLEGVNGEHLMLLEQVKLAEQHLLQARRHNTSLVTDKGRLDERIATLRLETDTTTREVKVAIDCKEKSLVDHDVLKLEVQRLRGLLNTQADAVFSLENRKQQLKASMEERRLEAEVHRESLRAELKLLRDDLHKVMVELKERSLKVDKLAAKFATLTLKNKPAGEDDEPKSQAYYVIKAAQEREELQREGDQLDVTIKGAEKDVGQLELALLQINGSNNTYNHSLRTIGMAHEQEKAQLKEQLEQVYDTLRFRRQEAEDMEVDVAAAEQHLASASAEHASLQAQLEELLRRKSEADRQLDEQRDKYQRASALLQKLQRQMRVKAGTMGVSHEQDIELQDIKEVTRAMLLEVKALAAQYPELEQAFTDAGIKIPSTTGPASGGSSRAGSSAGGSRAGSLGGSRPASVAGSKAGSYTSAKSQQSVRSNASRTSQPAIKTMELKL